jgi:hypothetical protein
MSAQWPKILAAVIALGSLSVLVRLVVRKASARRPILQAGLALTALWLMIGGILTVTARYEPSPENVVRFITEHPLGATGRAEVVAEFATRYLALDFVEQRELRQGEVDHFTRFTVQLTEPEKRDLIQKLVPREISLFFDAIMKKSDAERAKAWNKAKSQILDKVPSPQMKAFFAQDFAIIQEFLKMGPAKLLELLPADQALQAIFGLEQWQNDARKLRD